MAVVFADRASHLGSLLSRSLVYDRACTLVAFVAGCNDGERFTAQLWLWGRAAAGPWEALRWFALDVVCAASERRDRCLSPLYPPASEIA